MDECRARAGNNGQQYLYAQCFDLNGDGTTDVLVGGRRHAQSKEYSGIRWLEAPRDPAQRRDLAKWTTHFISPDAPSGHMFVITDIDQDGDMDLADATADFDTSERDEEVCWYENPGADSPALREPWKKHTIFKDPGFYAKPQLAVADLDGEGLTDIATQTQNHILIFRKVSKAPVKFEKIETPKPDAYQWIGRPIEAADLDGDGRLDLFAALIHNDGNLPADKFSVFMLRRTGDDLKKWRFTPIKKSDGVNSRNQWRGEKRDHLLARDLDGDGALDVLGNVEEHYSGNGANKKSVFSVVWFENPQK